MKQLVCGIQEDRKPAALLVCPQDSGDTSVLPPVPSPAHSGSPGQVTRSPSSPLPMGRMQGSCQFDQAFHHAIVTCMGRAGRPTEPWASPPGMLLLLPLKRSGGPSKVICRRGFTRGQMSPEAFCHLPKLWRAREAGFPALGEILMTPEPQGLGPLSLTIVLVQHCPCNLLVSAPGLLTPAGIRGSRSWFSIKSECPLPACHCARSLITVPAEASGCGA